ncbi:hypothetical protein ACLOJK_010282 [Asimina triloba]
MIPDPDPLILYACISRASTILAHFSSADHHPNLETLAPECLQNIPAFHRIYSYSIQDKIHVFLIEDPFVYFAILLEDDDHRCKSRGIEFLGRLKDAFLASIALRPAVDGVDLLAQGCFDDELRPVFQRLMRGEEDPQPVAVSDPMPVESLTRGSSVADPGDPTPVESLTRGSSVADPGDPTPVETLTRGSSVADPRDPTPVETLTRGSSVADPGDPTPVETLPRGSSVADPGDGGAENNVKMPAHSGVAVSKEYSLSPSPSPKGCGIDGGGRQQAQMLWRKHVRLVLLIDLAICCILFTVWMSICQGFRCVKQ